MTEMHPKFVGYENPPARLVGIEMDRLEPFYDVLTVFGVDPSEFQEWTVSTTPPTPTEIDQGRTVYVSPDEVAQRMLMMSRKGRHRDEYVDAFKPAAATALIEGVADSIMHVPPLSNRDRFKLLGSLSAGALVGNIVAHELIDLPVLSNTAEGYVFGAIGAVLGAGTFVIRSRRFQSLELANSTIKAFPVLYDELQQSLWPKYDFGQSPSTENL
jgi:hypothetical protein